VILNTYIRRIITGSGDMNTLRPITHRRDEDIAKHFGPVIALNGVSFDVRPGECHCLLGDNGAGKSTFIKTMSGCTNRHRARSCSRGKRDELSSPRDSMEAGIATVYQDLAMIPLMSVTATSGWAVSRSRSLGR
jgi:simple sugar transport system ATP-binding protein